MRFYYLIICAILFAGTSDLMAQKKFKTDDKFDKSGLNVMFYYQDHSYASFFDNNSDKIGNIDIDIEKVRGRIKSDSTLTILNPANWTFDIKRKLYGLHLEYFFDNDNFIYLTMPFETQSLTDQISFRVDNGNQLQQDVNKQKFPERTKSFLAFVGIGGEYCTYNNVFFHSVMGELRIPGGSQDFIPGSEVVKETYEDSKGNEAVRYSPPWPDSAAYFLSDGAFEMHLGTSVGVNFRKSYLRSTAKYILRGEELSDQIFGSAGFFYNGMEEATLKIGLNYYHSINEAPADYYFDYSKTPIYDRTLNGDIGFQLYLKKVIIDLNMQIPVWGKNAASNSIFTMKLGWHF